MDTSEILLFSLMCLTIISFWAAPIYISYACILVSIVFALSTGTLTFIGLLVLICVILSREMYQNAQASIRFCLGLILTIVTTAIYLHFIPGFENFSIANAIKLSPTSAPYTAYVNVDKSFAGFIFLIYFRSFNKSIKEWSTSLKIIPIPLAIVCSLLIGSAYAISHIKFDSKLPFDLVWWIPLNLLLVCVCEEVFYRGFIQKELMNALSKMRHGNMLAILITAFIFGLTHYKGNIALVALSSLAGIVYGYTYFKNHRLESPILVHFFVNLIHILFFSYPSLIK